MSSSIMTAINPFPFYQALTDLDLCWEFLNNSVSQGNAPKIRQRQYGFVESDDWEWEEKSGQDCPRILINLCKIQVNMNDILHNQYGQLMLHHFIISYNHV